MNLAVGLLPEGICCFFTLPRTKGLALQVTKNTIAKSSVLEVDIMIYLQLFDYFKYLIFLDTHFEFFF